MNKLLYTLLLVVALLVYPTPALAHEASAVLSLDPAVPMPGQPGTVQVTLVDPYGNPLPAAAVRASFGPHEGAPPPLVTLENKADGVFSGPLTSPDSAAGFIRLEVDFPDDQWHAMLQVRLGTDAIAIKDAVVELSEGKLGARKSSDRIPPHILEGAQKAGEAHPASEKKEPIELVKNWKALIGITVGVGAIAILMMRVRTNRRT